MGAEVAQRLQLGHELSLSGYAGTILKSLAAIAAHNTGQCTR
jgi:hypothetical protein